MYFMRDCVPVDDDMRLVGGPAGIPGDVEEVPEPALDLALPDVQVGNLGLPETDHRVWADGVAVEAEFRLCDRSEFYCCHIYASRSTSITYGFGSR